METFIFPLQQKPAKNIPSDKSAMEGEEEVMGGGDVKGLALDTPESTTVVNGKKKEQQQQQRVKDSGAAANQQDIENLINSN